MTVQATITGRIAEPKLVYTASGRPVLDLSVAATPRKKDRNTDEWSDDGAPFWVSVPVWGDEAERLNEVLRKGDQVSFTATLALEAFQKRDGSDGQKVVARFPKFLGVVPRTPQASQDRFSAPQTQNATSYQPAPNMAPQNSQNDPAGNLAQAGLWGGSDQRAPF